MTSARDRPPRLDVVWLCLEWPGDAHSGGVARYAYRLATELAPRVNLTVVTEMGGDALPGARMVYLPRSTSRLGRYYAQALRLRRVVKSLGDVDVVHAFGDDWAIGGGRAKHVRHFLGSSLSEARSSSGLRKINHYVLAALEKISERRADYRIAIGPESLAAFRCNIVMPPVVRIERVEVEKTPEPTVVFIGSHGGRKRGHLAEQAVSEAARRSGRDVKLIVFGPADDAVKWSASTIHRAGSTDDEVRRAVAAAWVLMSPSDYEGFGIPIFEALALETAVIATPNPGSSYQAGLSAGVALELVQDPRDLSRALDERLDSGPQITPAEAEANAETVGSLLRLSSVDTLLGVAYR